MDTEGSSHVSSDGKDVRLKEPRSDKQSRGPFIHTDSLRRQRRAQLPQEYDTEPSFAQQRSFFRLRARDSESAHVEAGASGQKHQRLPGRFGKAKGVLPEVLRRRKEGTRRHARDSARESTSQNQSDGHASQKQSNQEISSSEPREDRQIPKNSGERVRRHVTQGPGHDFSKPYGRGQPRIVKSRTWDEDRHRPIIRDETEGELDGFFNFVGSLSCASWRLLTRIPDVLAQVPGLTILLLEHVIPCFGRPRNYVSDE